MTRAPRVAFVALLAAWALLFAYLATIEPILHDGWWHALAHARRPFSLGALVDFIGDAYLHTNPRLGQWLTFVAFAPGPWHALLAAGFAVALLLGTFVLAYARAPRPRDLADTARLAAIAGLIYVCVPNPGQMLCYRPFTGNYVWAFCVTIALAAPYRIALARPAAPGRGALTALGMFVLGLAAGLANEHTGPTAILALAGATFVLRRRDGRFRPWTLAGLIGLAAGTALLVGAPGQSLRYHGLGAETSLVGNLFERGLGGDLRIVGMSFLYTIGAWVILAVALIKRRALSREVLILIAAALAIVLTVLLSPKQGARLFVAPAILLVAAAVRALDDAFTCRIARGVIAGLGAATAIACSAWLVHVQRIASAEFDARVAALRTAPPGSVIAVAPYTRFAPQWWTFGDDFRSAPLREHVARRVFGLDDVTLDTQDPRVLSAAGVSLVLVTEPPDPALARLGDPDGDGFSDQLFTETGRAAALDRFRAAVAAMRAHGGLVRADLIVRGFTWRDTPPVAFASWDATTGFTLPTGAPTMGARHLPAGGEPSSTPPARGAYFVATCDGGRCVVVAVATR